MRILGNIVLMMLAILKPITYEVLWSLLLHSEMNDLYFYNENHAIDKTCVFYEFYNDLGFELPEDRDLDMSDYPHVCIELSDENGYGGSVDIFMEDRRFPEDMTDEDKERFDTIRKKSPISHWGILIHMIYIHFSTK